MSGFCYVSGTFISVVLTKLPFELLSFSRSLDLIWVLWRGFNRQIFSCCRGRDRCRHFVINQSESGQFVVCGDTEGHDTVSDLIEYYKTSAIQPFGEYLTSSCFEVRQSSSLAFFMGRWSRMKVWLVFCSCRTWMKICMISSGSALKKSLQPLLELCRTCENHR